MYDVATNPIPRSGLFATMTLEEIQDRIEQMPKAQRADAYLTMMLTLNACNQLVQDQILSKDIFAS